MKWFQNQKQRKHHIPPPLPPDPPIPFIEVSLLDIVISDLFCKINVLCSHHKLLDKQCKCLYVCSQLMSETRLVVMASSAFEENLKKDDDSIICCYKIVSRKLCWY